MHVLHVQSPSSQLKTHCVALRYVALRCVALHCMQNDQLALRLILCLFSQFIKLVSEIPSSTLRDLRGWELSNESWGTSRSTIHLKLKIKKVKVKIISDNLSSFIQC